MDKISEFINKQFDTRCEAMVATYILEKGMEFCKQITDEEIDKIKGDDFMTDRFVQSLVKVSRTICTDFSPMDIMYWIRMNCLFDPFPKEYEIYKDECDEGFWDKLVDEFADDEDTDCIVVQIMKERKE